MGDYITPGEMPAETSTLKQLDRASGYNTCQYIKSTERGDFLIQIAWPLAWDDKGSPPDGEDIEVHSLIVVDGNAYFATAVDITRRMEYLNNTRTLTIAIGYPNPRAVYDYRRGPDLTPASPDGKYEMPLDRHGNPRTDIQFGKAREHLEFIQHDVMEYVYGTLFAHVPRLRRGRKALYGHSYGGIFALHVLFKGDVGLFDCFIAASPIVWWNWWFLVKSGEPEFLARSDYTATRPSLFMTYGCGRQDLRRREGESDEGFQKRLGIAEGYQMKQGVSDMASRLRGSGKLKVIETCEFPDEDHGSAAVTGLQRGIMKFLKGEI